MLPPLSPLAEPEFLASDAATPESLAFAIEKLVEAFPVEVPFFESPSSTTASPPGGHSTAFQLTDVASNYPNSTRKSNSRSGYRIFCRVSNPQDHVMPSTEDVCAYFSQFGHLLDCYIPESATNVAYVCFEECGSLDAVLSHSHHTINGTPLMIAKAAPRPDYAAKVTDRIFVKYIPDGIYRTQLKNYFSSFGEVTDVYIPKDKATGVCRKFAFVTFGSNIAARRAITAKPHFLSGSEVQVMPAEPRPAEKQRTMTTETIASFASASSTASLNCSPLSSTTEEKPTTLSDNLSTDPTSCLSTTGVNSEEEIFDLNEITAAIRKISLQW